MNNLLYNIAITQLPMIGDINAKKLIAYCGSTKDVFKQKLPHLLKIPGIGDATAAAILKGFTPALKRAEEEISFMEKNNIQSFFFLDEQYPKRLKHCEDAPVMLYHKGNSNFENPKSIAIVGTRKATAYGKKMTEKLVEELATYNPIIVSGMAFGIDICAHRAALKNGLQTTAVLAHGLDIIYPAQHVETAKHMLNNGGWLSDFTSNTNPDRENFPKRNRIVAGIVDAVVVIEASTKGGALITANIANTYNRDVFAFPGRLDDTYSQGCNRLIKTNKAVLIENAQDIAYICNWEHKQNGTSKQNKLFIELTIEQQIIVDFIKEVKQISLDDLSLVSKITLGKLAGVLLDLELKNVLKALPGKVYTLAT